MKILFLGDIYGAPGRQAVQEYLPLLVHAHQVDVVIANGENSAHGRGITTKTYNALREYGVDIITTGNHYLATREKKEFYEQPALLRPANIDSSAWGRGSAIFEKNGFRLRVTNLLGRAMITELQPQNPFTAFEAIGEDNEPAVHIVDFHAEATAEKYAFAYRFSGQVSAVIGTHTHVQTADARILPGGTGYISDAGMCGPYHSIIGCEIEGGIYKASTGMPIRLEVADGPAQINAVLIEVNPSNGRCLSIKTINLNPERGYEI